MKTILPGNKNIQTTAQLLLYIIQCSLWFDPKQAEA